MRFLALSLLLAVPLLGQLTDSEKEHFLLNAKIEKVADLPVGSTQPLRATLSLDGFTHDAHIQQVDESAPAKELATGLQLNFRDYWGFNIVAYRLDRMLGLGMVPVTVERKYKGHSAAIAWWVDDVAMMERERWEKDIAPPDLAVWNQQMRLARMFNQLVYNTDPNLGNVLIDKDWKIWLVDYTRAFRVQTDLLKPEGLAQVDQTVIERLRQLSKESIRREMGDLLTRRETEALLERRDAVVQLLEQQIQAQIDNAVLYDVPR